MQVARRGSLLLALSCACQGHVRPPDADGDGVVDYDDCAPYDPGRFPGHAEVCDGVDNDCDRSVDEGLIQTWFVDVDRDGHGDPARHTDTCAPDPTWVTVGDDCDDVQADVFPGAPERCDDKDNDCANGIDDVRWFANFDDGWPTALATTTGDADLAVNPEDGNTYLRLVRAQADQAGGIWHLPRVPGERWRLRFRVRISGAGGLVGEGLTFAFLQSDVGPVVGGGGVQLGLYGADVDGWALELVAAQTSVAEPARWEPRFAFRTVRDGALIAARAGAPRWDPELWHQVEYQQDGPSFQLRLDGLVVWSGTVDVTPGPFVTMGFTAATSSGRRMQVGLDDIELACPDTPDGPGVQDSGGS